MQTKWVKYLFIVAGLYDFIVGVAFLLWFKNIYNYFNITLPNHDGYIQFAAAVVTTFGIGFWFVAADPVRNRDIIKMGILLKTSYSSIVLGHWFAGNVPWVWVPWAWCDLGFLVLFIIALRSVSKEK